MAQAEAEAKRANDALDPFPAGTMKHIAEIMESQSKRSRQNDDFLDEQGRPPHPPNCKFNFEGKLLQPINYNDNDLEGINHLLTVHPDTRDKIIKAEFVLLDKINLDDVVQQSLRQAELSKPGYMSRNVPVEPPKTLIKSKFDLLRQLFQFSS